MDQRLAALSDIAAEAHADIQKYFEHINPIIGVSQNMRSSGFPADAMAIDCLKTNKRIILILHDHHPDIVSDIIRQSVEDTPIWENKQYQNNPLLCDGDGQITKYRKWAPQFY